MPEDFPIRSVADVPDPDILGRLPLPGPCSRIAPAAVPGLISEVSSFSHFNRNLSRMPHLINVSRKAVATIKHRLQAKDLRAYLNP
jgi:hypothetical protein